LKLWLTDPKTGQPSVSLTLSVLSFIACIIASGLEMAKIIDNTSLVLEMFLANLALYLGRRWTGRTGTLEGDERGT